MTGLPTGSVRQRSAPLHTWSGLIVGWLLFAIAVTGTATVLRGELDSWMRPEIPAPSAQVVEDDAAAIAAGLTAVLEEHPETTFLSLRAPSIRSPLVLASYSDPDAPLGYGLTGLDPVSGHDADARDTLGGEFLYRFHFQLQLPYPWGRYLAVLAAICGLVAIVSGVIIHRRIFADFFTLRFGKGKRSWLDAHNVLGVLGLPFHVMIVATGVYTLITLAFPWSTQAAYGQDSAAMFQELRPVGSAIPNEPAGELAKPGDIATMARRARTVFDGGNIGRVDVSFPGDAASAITFNRSDADHLAYADELVAFDAVSGTELAHYRERRPALRTYNVLYGLHMGRFAREAGQWLYLLLGAAFAATIATGLVIWTHSPSRRNAIGRGFVVRMNAGILLAVPSATLAFLYANRLIPVEWPNRAAAEVSVFFWAMALVFVYAFLRRSPAVWAEGLIAQAVGWALLPVLSFVTTGRGLWSSLASGDRVFVTIDIACALCAVGFALAARGALQKRNAVSVR